MMENLNKTNVVNNDEIGDEKSTIMKQVGHVNEHLSEVFKHDKTAYILMAVDGRKEDAQLMVGFVGSTNAISAMIVEFMNQKSGEEIMREALKMYFKQ